MNATTEATFSASDLAAVTFPILSPFPSPASPSSTSDRPPGWYTWQTPAIMVSWPKGAYNYDDSFT